MGGVRCHLAPSHPQPTPLNRTFCQEFTSYSRLKAAAPHATTGGAKNGAEHEAGVINARRDIQEARHGRGGGAAHTETEQKTGNPDKSKQPGRNFGTRK